MHNFLTLTLLLLAGHALCDYPLQGDYLAREKNPMLAGDGWIKAMTAHCLIQAGMVLLLTKSLPLAIAEFVIHFVTDYSKCRGWISSNADQVIHYICKVNWAFCVVWGITQ